MITLDNTLGKIRQYILDNPIKWKTDKDNLTISTRNNLDYATWKTQVIKAAVEKINGKNVKFIEHQAISEWLNSWGNKHELTPPSTSSL